MNFRKSVDKVLQASMRTFGEHVEFHPQAGGIFVVKGIYDDSFHSVDPDTQQVVSVNQPNLGVNLNDLKFTVKRGDIVVIRETSFTVEDKQDDGQGGSRLFLHKESVNDRIKEARIR